MDADLSAKLPQSLAEEQQKRQATKRLEIPVLTYWGISAVLGVVFLRDWITSWNVGETLSHPWLVVYLIVTLTIGQVAYSIIARHDNRPIRVLPTIIFALGNGIFETFAFALVYRLGEWLGVLVGQAVVPHAASGIGFTLGVVFFIIYGGSIHAFFWLKILPPHLNESPIVLVIRRYRMLSEIALVLGWCLCFWLTDDIWTVVFFHSLVDLGLMLRVRPHLFVSRKSVEAYYASQQANETAHTTDSSSQG